MVLGTALDKNVLRVAGIDEAGRGPLAGAVIAAAVILDKPIAGLRDSKKLSPKKRKLHILMELRVFYFTVATLLSNSLKKKIF